MQKEKPRRRQPNAAKKCVYNTNQRLYCTRRKGFCQMKRELNDACKRDCFAFSGGYFKHDGGCLALKKMICIKGNCPFYKPISNKEENQIGKR